MSFLQLQCLAWWLSKKTTCAAAKVDKLHPNTQRRPLGFKNTEYASCSPRCGRYKWLPLKSDIAPGHRVGVLGRWWWVMCYINTSEAVPWPPNKHTRLRSDNLEIRNKWLLVSCKVKHDTERLSVGVSQMLYLSASRSPAPLHLSLLSSPVDTTRTQRRWSPESAATGYYSASDGHGGGF